jgi:hypothetical protein
MSACATLRHSVGQDKNEAALLRRPQVRRSYEKRGPSRTVKTQSNQLADGKIASPVAATATKVSSAAEEQEKHNDNQEQIHRKPPLE